MQIYYFMCVKLTFWKTFGKPCRTSLKCGVEKKETRGGSWLLHSIARDRNVWWILMSNPTRLSEQLWTWRVWNHCEASLHHARMFLRYLCSSRGRTFVSEDEQLLRFTCDCTTFSSLVPCRDQLVFREVNMLLRTRRVNTSLSKVKEQLK